MHRFTRWLMLLAALAAVPAFAATPDEILPPGQAYQVSVSNTDGRAVHLHFNIHDSYYLYKSRFHFIGHSEGVTLGTPELPRGIPEHDKFFGDIEIYRHGVDVTLPYKRTGAAPERLTLEVVYQGCADIGFCYPPQHESLAITLPKPGSAGDDNATTPVPSLLELAGGAGAKNQQFLPPDQAFVFGAEYRDGALHAHWAITKGYYMYRDRFQFAVDDGSGVTLGQPAFPKGEEKDDENFGKVEIYRGDLDLAIPVHAPDGVKQFTLKATYQGCADAGLCYPPIHRAAAIDLTGGAATIAAAEAEAAAEGAPPAATGAPMSEQDRLGDVIRSSGLGWVLLVFFGAGLLLTFTPCVLPMLPIISSLVVGQGAHTSTGKAFVISLVYVLGMAVTYTAAGVAVALAGASVQIWFQNPWVLGAFAALFVALAMSMFGVYELQMPAGIQARLAQLSNRQQGGTLVGAAIMGVLSALIVGPCVSAPLVAALVAIGQSGEPVRGGLALFSLSLGMGVPLIIAGTSAGKLLPRAGAWMNVVKAIFGFLLLGLAVWFVERVAPAWVSMLAYALLALASGLYLFTIEARNTGWRVSLKTIGAALIIWGAALLAGLALGNRDPLQPLAGIGSGTAAVKDESLSFTPIKSVADLQRAVAQASAEGRPAMLDFYADWCISCKEMDAYVFTDAQVHAALADVVLLRADVTANDAADQALLKHFGIYGPPGIMFFDKAGNELKADAVVGYMPADRFRRHILDAFGHSR